MKRFLQRIFSAALATVMVVGLVACGSRGIAPGIEQAAPSSGGGGAIVSEANSPDYRLGPGDTINIFVWKNEQLSATVPIRPDGRFSTPLIEDMQASGKTPTELARDIENKLRVYVQDPIVTVIVNSVGAQNRQHIRVLGQVVSPQSIPYRSGMTALDVLIAVGGLNNFADGNRAVLVREEGGVKRSYRLRLDDLVRRGDINADRPVLPGDTIIIPESWF